MCLLINREDVVNILKQAFKKTVDSDYKNGFCISEEDLRANIDRYIREKLDADNSWRVFLNLTTKTSKQQKGLLYRPDLSFLTLLGEVARVEIFVEIKNWPSKDEILNDIYKLNELRNAFKEDDPSIIFTAIIGPNIDQNYISEITNEIKIKYRNVITLFEHHYYTGPWNEETQWDPWRQRLRHINFDT